MELYRRFGFQMTFSGGETADLPDQVGSTTFDVSVYADADEADLITGGVKPGDKIFGFRSDGQAKWEDRPNSGMMSNGVTLARICLMLGLYTEQFPYLIRQGGQYRGRFAVGDKPDCLGGMSVSEAILSPTRQWAIVIRELIKRLKAQGILDLLHGISMNTGGGAHKIAHVGRGIKYRKTMPEPPDFFRLIQCESGESWENMYHGLNCGIGLDVVGADDQRLADAIFDVSQASGVGYHDLGLCEASGSDQNEVVLITPFGTFPSAN